MSSDHEFRRAIEEIKLRAPIESIVGETVDLKAKGRTLWGCCPFHEERTPSFKIDPAQGTWYCFGACRTGGDVIRFVQERGNMTFMDALSLLAAQFGVDLPKQRPKMTRDNDPGLAALAFAEGFFRRELTRPDGKAARDYLKSRGFGENAVEAFGLGWAPHGGRALVDAARREKIEIPALLASGLARVSSGDDRGRAPSRNTDVYSFFRGRLMIPIRDERGQTVAFGGRVVGDSDGPKYVNTSETKYFHKGRLIYALDRAIDTVRRSGHLILVEGYTDVIAAHVAGQSNVGAVLGTATTDMHAGLVRRAGAKRVSLVFDGDEAGRRAAWRGLEGLLPLDMTLEVVPMPDGVDPADVLMGADGAAVFASRVETGISWFEFVADCVEAKRGEGARALALEVDRALELIRRLPRPVEIDTAIVDLSTRLDIPRKTLREQFETLEARGRRGAASARGQGGAGGRSGPGQGLASGLRRGSEATPLPLGATASGGPESEVFVSGPQKGQKTPLDRRSRTAYGSLIGAALREPSLIPRLRPWIDRLPAPDLAHISQTLVDLWEHEDADITTSFLMNALSGHPARDLVAGISEHAATADDPSHLFESAVRFLEQREHQGEVHRLQEEIQSLETRATADPVASGALEAALMRLLELQRRLVQP